MQRPIKMGYSSTLLAMTDRNDRASLQPQLGEQRYAVTPYLQTSARCSEVSCLSAGRFLGTAGFGRNSNLVRSLVFEERKDQIVQAGRPPHGGQRGLPMAYSSPSRC